MTLFPLRLPPGVYRNGTRYQTRGRWYDANLVRWFAGTLRPIGGWTPVQETTLSGTEDLIVTGAPRALLAWRDNNTKSRLAIGTNVALYSYIQGVLTDITPYDLVAGQADSSLDVGPYGDGAYGVGPYGTGDLGQAVLTEADTWQLDTFGQFLVGCLTSDGRLFLWDLEDAEAIPMENAPIDCVGVVVTPEGFVVALGAGGDARALAWASQRTTDVWTPASENTAGDWLLEGRGSIMCGRRSKEETLIWTDKDLHAMRYIGGVLVYAVVQIDSDCGIISRHAVATVGGSRAVWMGNRRFFSYDGFVRPIPSDVGDHVFSDFNYVQRHKVVAVPNAQFSEVTWFYPSSGADENDRYVTYNYAENHWTIGELVRSAGVDRVPFESPILAAPDGALYEHEKGFEYDSLTPFAESGPQQLGDGDQRMTVDRLVPDEKTLGDARVVVFTGNYPIELEQEFGPYTLAEPTSVRFSGRQVRIRVEQVRATDWRVGELRFDVRPSSRR